jgi:hypothetical protein
MIRQVEQTNKQTEKKEDRETRLNIATKKKNSIQNKKRKVRIFYR